MPILGDFWRQHTRPARCTRRLAGAG